MRLEVESENDVPESLRKLLDSEIRKVIRVVETTRSNWTVLVASCGRAGMGKKPERNCDRRLMGNTAHRFRGWTLENKKEVPLDSFCTSTGEEPSVEAVLGAYIADPTYRKNTEF